MGRDSCGQRAGGEWDTATVADLQRDGVLLVEDGNHGEYRPRRDEFVTEGVAFIRAADMDAGRVLIDSASKINDIARQRIKKGIGAPGDVLLSHKGTVGKVALVPDDVPPFVCSPQTTFWRCLDESILDRRYLYAFLRSPAFSLQLAARAGETDMAPYVSLTSQRTLEIALPPLSEQRTIAHILGTLDDKIELNRRMNETLEEMARALFKSWFIDFDPVHAKAALRNHTPNRSPFDWTVERAQAYLDGVDSDIAALFPDRFVDSELGAIPGGWEVKMLGDCFHLTMGQSPPGNTYNDNGAGLPFFQGRTDFGFRYPQNRKFCEAPTRIAEQDDTLVSVRAPVGDINMALEKCCIGRGVAALRHKSRLRSFTYYSIWAIQQELRQYEHTGTVFGAINKKQFEMLKTIEPPRELLLAFESFIGPMDEYIKTHVSESRTLIALRDTWLPKLVSGEVRVRNTEEFIRGAN